MIDTHCHLDFAALAPQDALLQQCARLGVQSLVLPAVSADNWDQVLAYADNSQVRVALGLHPLFIDQHRADDIERLASLLSRCPQVIAIGEIGLDFFSEALNKERQLEIFVAQLALARQSSKPVLLHVRKAHDQVLKQLRQYRLSRAGIVHAFSGSEQQARQYLDLGFKLGMGGAVTYPRAQKLRRLLQSLPRTSWVLETDAPDMAPSFAPDKINSPLYLPRIAQCQAEIVGVEASEWMAQTTQNAHDILDLA